MFTGLVEGIGRVRSLEPSEAEIQLTVDVPEPLLRDGGCRLGESVAINGCCLTAIAVDGAAWTFEAGRETLSKTTLGELRAGSPVNLERALPATGRLGGHIVQGHIDGVGVVASIRQDGDWTNMSFTMPAELAAQLVPKGSIAVDGVSLTVVEATDAGFSIALIPHTLAETTLRSRRVGDRVNLETDILGKYVHRWLTNQRESIKRLATD